MGSETGRENERPLHRVWVDSFAMAVYQVTNAEYGDFLATTNRPPPPMWGVTNFNDAAQPVVSVSWFDAVAYCAWLAEMTGLACRLPTEAEWERAARAGVDHQPYPWGDDPPESLRNYSKRWRSGPEPVGSGRPNRYGLYNMCDNVHEWCADWYGPDYYTVSPQSNPTGPAMGSRRVSRGGSWRHQVKVSRCSARSSIPPSFQYADYGFRIACGI